MKKKFIIKRPPNSGPPHVVRKTGTKRVQADRSLTPLKTSLHRFTAAMEQVKDVVLSRDDEIKAFILCILVKQHMMLEGVHGIAKSMLADEVFRRITGATVFEKQLMKGTQTDEVFGPMNAKRYKEEAVWSHNIEGYLPSAHFAFIDEVYRAGDSLLGSLMGMLNERKFHNGTIVERCPLISAIGTTNFVTDTEELKAFHDRWLVTSRLKPLSQPTLRRKMLANFHKRLLAQSNEEDEIELRTVPLSDIINIHAHLSEVDVPDEMVALYEELMRAVVRNIGSGFTMSDRRACFAYHLTLADALRAGNDRLQPENLRAAMFGACIINDDATTQAFEQAYERIVGTFSRTQEEVTKARITLNKVKKLCAMFDPKQFKRNLRRVYLSADEFFDSITNMDGDEAPTQEVTKAMYDDCRKLLSGVMLELEDLPKMKEIISECKKAKAADLGDEEYQRRVSAFVKETKDATKVDNDGEATPDWAEPPDPNLPPSEQPSDPTLADLFKGPSANTDDDEEEEEAPPSRKKPIKTLSLASKRAKQRAALAARQKAKSAFDDVDDV